MPMYCLFMVNNNTIGLRYINNLKSSIQNEYHDDLTRCYWRGGCWGHQNGLSSLSNYSTHGMSFHYSFAATKRMIKVKLKRVEYIGSILKFILRRYCRDTYLFVHLDHSDHNKSPGNRQEWVLQGYSLSTAFRPSEPQSSRSAQSRPLPWGTGWVQERYRFLTPPPQSTTWFSFPFTWHVVTNLLHGLHPPSIASKEKFVVEEVMLTTTPKTMRFVRAHLTKSIFIILEKKITLWLYKMVC